MKLSGMAGTGSGKLGSNVYATNSGEQIVRIYQPNVSNPNTAAQVSQRARMKLMSQLAAAVAPVLAIPKDGMKSSRNQFISRNFDYSSANNGQAMITIENLQLTKGSVGLPAIVATRDAQNNRITVQLAKSATEAVDRVCYVLFTKSEENTLQYVNSVVVGEVGMGGFFAADLPYVAGDAVIYAYGMKDLNKSASSKYGNYQVKNGEDIANLVMSRKLSANDYQFTQTRGTEIFAGETTSQTATANQANIFLTPSGPGSVIGAGIYADNEKVYVTAEADEGSQFIGWKINGSNRIISNSATMQVEAQGTIDLIAVFENPESTTGGLNGQSLVNPIPYDTARVKIDNNEAIITSGYVYYPDNFDNLVIDNIDPDHHLVFVPEGSYLGADDNIEFSDEDPATGQYVLSATNTGEGAVYYDGQPFFYLFIAGWLFSVIDIGNQSFGSSPEWPIQINNSSVNSVTIEGAEPYYSVAVADENKESAKALTYDSDNNLYRGDNLNVSVPCWILVNGRYYWPIVERT